MPILIRVAYNNHIYNDTFKVPFETGGTPGHVDLPRLRDGMNGGAFWSVYWECPSNMTDFSDEIYAPSMYSWGSDHEATETPPNHPKKGRLTNNPQVVQATLQQVDLVTRLQALYPSQFSPPVNASTALAAFQRGQLISPLGVEGLHQIGNRAANLRHLHALGVRYATLTHNCPNRFADAALWSTPASHGPFVPPGRGLWGGLSPAGKALVHEMNRIGMLVDLSHTSIDTQLDVLGGGEDGWEGSLAPVMYSHSSAYAVCPHPRNVHDRVLQLVKQRRGVVMVNFSPSFISCTESDNESGVPDFYPANSTLAQVVRHVTYIGDLIGYDHVGIGSDFDGIPNGPEGLEDVSKFPDLVAALLREGVSDQDAAKVVGGNILRVWADADAVALDLQAKGTLPLEDDLPSFKFGASDM